MASIYSGWWMILTCATICSYNSGLLFYGFTAFFNPLVNEFGWSRAATSLGYGMYRLEGGLLAPLMGFLIDRWGPRRMMLAAVITMGFGFILLSRIDSLWNFYAVFLLIAFGNSLGFSFVGYYVAAHWFIKKRGIALGLFTGGLSLGGLLVPVLSLLITTLGWRTAAVLAGMGMWMIGIPLSLLIRRRPESYERILEGESRGKQLSSQPGPEGIANLTKKEKGVTCREAIRMRCFWLFALGLVVPMATTSALYVHQIPFLLEAGIPVEMAAFVVTGTVVLSGVWRVVFGWLSDRINRQLIMSIAMACLCVGFLFFSHIRESWEIFPYMIFFAAGYGAMLPLRPALQAEYFGTVAFGSIQGVLQGTWIAGTILGPVIAGRFFDITGDYRRVFMIYGIMTLIAIPLILASKHARNVIDNRLQETM